MHSKQAYLFIIYIRFKYISLVCRLRWPFLFWYFECALFHSLSLSFFSSCHQIHFFAGYAHWNFFMMLIIIRQTFNKYHLIVYFPAPYIETVANIRREPSQRNTNVGQENMISKRSSLETFVLILSLFPPSIPHFVDLVFALVNAFDSLLLLFVKLLYKLFTFR